MKDRLENPTYELIDLSKAEAPKLFEMDSYEKIRQDMLDDFRKRLGEKQYSFRLSDPLIKMLEVWAYRETLITKSMNDNFKDNLLPYAAGEALESIATLFNEQRASIDKEFNQEIPEQDGRLRERILRSFDTLSTAGSGATYQAQCFKFSRMLSARSETPDLLVDAKPISESAGSVKIFFLFKYDHMNKSVSAEASMNQIIAEVNKLRPITDRVISELAIPKKFTINVYAKFLAGIDTNKIKGIIENNIKKLSEETYKVSKRLYESSIFAAIHVPGVESVTYIMESGGENPEAQNGFFAVEQNQAIYLELVKVNVVDDVQERSTGQDSPDN